MVQQPVPAQDPSVQVLKKTGSDNKKLIQGHLFWERHWTFGMALVGRCSVSLHVDT